MENTSFEIKAYLAKQFNTLYYFYRYIGYKIFILLVFSFLSVLADGLGITMFIPLLQIADGKSSVAVDNQLYNVLNAFVSFLGLPLNLVVVLVLIALLFILKASFVYFTLSYQNIVLQTFIRKIRIDNSIGLSELNYKEFVSSDVGRLQNTLTGEANLVVSACSSYLETIKNAMIVVVYLGLAFTLDLKFSILILVGGIISHLVYKRFYKTTVTLSRDFTDLSNEYSGLVVQSVSQFKYLKATGRNVLFLNRMKRLLDKIMTNSVRSGNISAFLTSVREPMMVIIVCIIISVQVLVFKDSLSSVMVILVLFYRAMAYVISMQTTWNQYLGKVGSMENMKSFEHYLKINKEHNSGKLQIEAINQIEVKNLHLNFDEVKVINGIDISIDKKSSVALVGETGSGKSTLVNVISGLLKPTEGAIIVNGVPLTDINLLDYRAKMGYVSQDPTIFNGDIFDNITFWTERTQENRDKFWKVVEMASLKSFLMDLPQKEASLLGNNGLNLSGGQKQRVSIARELYRDIDLLILDEATSALDAQTEKDIKDSLMKLHGKITIITIAHRLSTIKDVDIIYLLDKGTVVAQGTFDELKLKSSYFKAMTDLQGV